MKKLLKWTVLNYKKYTFINYSVTERIISRALVRACRKASIKDTAPPWGGVNCAYEQILVVVAISNMRYIMADEKKGYIRTLIDYMLVDPKGTCVGGDRPRTSVCGDVRKGNVLTFTYYCHIGAGGQPPAPQWRHEKHVLRRLLQLLWDIFSY